MKRYRWVLGCCLLLSIGVLWAEDKSDLRALQQDCLLYTSDAADD